MYRRRGGGLEVLLVHPGGPFWAGKDLGAWSIPKGQIEPHEGLLAAAVREFAEETGLSAAGPFLELTPVRQKGGKVVLAWAFEGDCDASRLISNSVRMQWPPGSGRVLEFSEIDKMQWFPIEEARQKINPAQSALLDELEIRLAR